MSEKVELSVKADFNGVMQDLQNLQRRAGGVADGVKRSGTELDKNLSRAAKNTELHFERVRDLGRRLADQLRGYFADMTKSAAFALEGVKSNFGLKQQMIDGAKGALELHDAIRKIGDSLGVASGRLTVFQESITKAFSAAGFGAGETVRALQGLAGTRVEGEGNVTEYALTATKLAQAGGQSGQEGEIAKAMAEVQRTRGIDQNDMGAMRALANSVRGRNPLEKLQAQNETYLAMEPTARGKYGPQTMAGLAATRKEVGPEMDAFIKKMSQGWLEKLPAAAQGLGKILGPNGIDFDQVRKNHKVLSRLGDDTNASGATLGLSADEARGLFALFKHADRAQKAQDLGRTRGGSLDEDVSNTRGLSENAGAVKNQVTGAISGELSGPLDKVNKLVGGASKSLGGSAALMGGGFLAAMMGAGGLKALSGAMGGKLGGAAGLLESGGKAAALEQITGNKTIPVFVVNLGEIGGGLMGGKIPGAGGIPSAGGGPSLVDKANVAALGLSIGLGIGTYLEEKMNKSTQGKTSDGNFEGNLMERMFYQLAKSNMPLLKILGSVNDTAADVVRMIEGGRNDAKRGDWKATAPGSTKAAGNAAAAAGKN